MKDKYLQILFLYGLQNLFKCDSYKLYPRFFNVLIFLFTSNNEKKLYNLDWHKKLLSLLTTSNFFCIRSTNVEKISKVSLMMIITFFFVYAYR